jgi:hypothetical protein
MINQNGLSNQLPNEIKSAFDELQILQHLRKAGFKKKFGFTCSYLFQLVFVLFSIIKIGFNCLKVIKATYSPAKMLFTVS